MIPQRDSFSLLLKPLGYRSLYQLLTDTPIAGKVTSGASGR